MDVKVIQAVSSAVLGISLVVAAVFLLYHGVDGAARAILFAAAATAFGSAAYSTAHKT